MYYATLPGPRQHNTHPNCYAPVDRNGQRYLFANLAGNLFMLLLELYKDQEQDENSSLIVKGMKVRIYNHCRISRFILLEIHDSEILMI